MAIYLVPFPGVYKFQDEKRAWNMNPVILDGDYTRTFWLGKAHNLNGSDLTYHSYLCDVSREQLWKELHEWKGGLHRWFANQRHEVKYGRPTRSNVSLRVSCLIECACYLERDGNIALMYEDEDHAFMIARCIEWVRHIVFEVGDYRKHEPRPRR